MGHATGGSTAEERLQPGAEPPSLPGAMPVHVLKGYGAMQMGTHRFFALQPGRPDRLTESGKFIDLWKQQDGGWKLARVISYDHQLAPAGD